MTRKYELRKRAQHQEETRQRIVEATVALHETVGPARTTISAIAEQAGVDRSTVYRLFPDERAIFAACTSHYLARNPPPTPAAWHATGDPEVRLRIALTEVYAYHERTERMTERAARDLPELPTMQEVLAPYFEQWAAIQEALTSGWDIVGQGRALLVAAIAHATDFSTWRSLVREQGLNNLQAVELMVCLVRCSANCPEERC